MSRADTFVFIKNSLYSVKQMELMGKPIVMIMTPVLTTAGVTSALALSCVVWYAILVPDHASPSTSDPSASNMTSKRRGPIFTRRERASCETQ